MTANFTLRWRVLSNDFPRVKAAMTLKAQDIVAKAALDIEAGAKTRAPVDTGTLRNSIRAYRVAATHWRVVVGADYGVHVEWGTRYMAAQPYLRPAVTEVQPQFLDAMRRIAS